MNYPIEILPNIERKLISCDVSNYYLIRSTKTNVPSELLDEITGEVKQGAICTPREHVIDLSTSILGVFNFDHNLIQLTEDGNSKYAHYCQPDINVDPPSHGVDFVIDNNKGFLILLINNICNQQPVEYTLGDFPSKIFTATCRVVHTPARWNYWHYSIKWHLDDYGCYVDDLEDIKLMSRIKKRLSGHARAMLARFATITQPPFNELPPYCYTK